MADHARRFLALSLRNMEVDFWKKADYSPYPLSYYPIEAAVVRRLIVLTITKPKKGFVERVFI